MFAELLGREDGYCRGRGGSMHIADLSNGNLGANGIVAGSLTYICWSSSFISVTKERKYSFMFLW
jgi:pyruvate dehydrogenase E1 component alpha subunit